MKLIADLHTHTIASVHAYSTVLENLAFARQEGLKAIAITDHGPKLGDAPDLVHFYNLKVLPEQWNGVRILKGVEANLLNQFGELDVPVQILESLDWVIASFHTDVCSPQTLHQHTCAYMNAVENPFVDCIGHSGNPAFAYDYEAVVKEIARRGKVLEINESSFVSRKGSGKNCMQLIRLCKKHGALICLDSDAHFASQIGKFPKNLAMLKECNFPEELVLNADEQRLQAFVHRRKQEKLTAFSQLSSDQKQPEIK